MVYYLKYRPQTLSDLVGQEPIAQTLNKALKSNRLAHAYLFYGPRGVGKTSTARILAKMVNCTGGVGDPLGLLDSRVADASYKDTPNLTEKQVPCNKCSACVSITDGTALDLIEIDAASNRGIDDIRELRDRIRLSPTHLRKKVYVIDECHMLTNEAFNALLKTLEEPPEHCLFILATTEIQKIPPTILSRVQRLDFQPATTEALTQALKRVVEGEKLDIDEEALRLIAQKSDGSFRDGVKLLDQLSSGDSKLTTAMVESALRNSRFELQIQLLQSLAKRDAKAALELTISEVASGVSLKEYTSSVMEMLRLMLLIKHGVSEIVKRELNSEKYQVLEKLSQEFTKERLVEILSNFQEAVEKLKFTSLSSLPLEIALVESCVEPSQEPTVKMEDKIVTSVIQGVSERSSTGTENIGEVSPGTLSLQQDFGNLSKVAQGHSGVDKILKQDLETSLDRKVHNDLDESSIELLPSKEENKVEQRDGSELDKIQDRWTYVLETIRPYNYSLEAMLRSVKIGSCEDGRVILKVPYTFHQRILETPRNRDLLESVLSDILGKSAKVYCELDTKLTKIEDIANIEAVAADDEVIRLAAEIFNS